MTPGAPGRVSLVGAGPGDPGLLTLAGRDALAHADLVVYDYLVNPRLLDWAPPRAERFYAGKRKGCSSIPQDRINALLVEHARAGRHVVRLKGGDPFLFGRGAEEAEFLKQHGIPFRVIPGVTAAVAVAAYAGIPITHRDASSSVLLATGHQGGLGRASGEPGALAGRRPGTVVLYMASTRLDEIRRTLLDDGWPPETPAALIQWGTLPRQRTIVARLDELPEQARDAQIGSPSLLIVGPVVARRAQLAWFEHLPLAGRSILITRPADEAAQAAVGLEAMGAEVLLAPTVAIMPLDDTRPLDAALESLDQFDWLVFTSGNGVRHFINRLVHTGRDLRALGRIKLAAIGPGTASVLAEFHLRADLVPETYRSEDLAAALAGPAAGRRVLLARADRGRAVLRDTLACVAAEVTEVATYRNVDVDSLDQSILDRLNQGSIDWITLTSSAITRRLHDLLPPAARQQIGRTIRLASISPVTSQTAQSLGWPVAAEANPYLWDSLVDALIAVDHAGPHAATNR